MFEKLLQESGNEFVGSRVSGIGSRHVDEERVVDIPVFIPEEGAAEIVTVSVLVPTIIVRFIPGVPFVIGVLIKNVGDVADMLFVKITNSDTGDNLGRQQIFVNAGDTAPWLTFPITLTQTTDFNGLIEAGHIE